jgi:hypothetical protein
MAPVGDVAVLVFSEAPLYDFTLVEYSTEQRHVVSLTNTGTRTATAIVAAAPGKPFTFAGGQWPGAAGDCGETLESGTACLVDVAFNPPRLGPATGSLTVDYDDGEGKQQVELGLAGAGSGSFQLIMNGDAETMGDPPPSWDELVGAGWTTTTQFSHGGLRSITPGDEPNGEVVLGQDQDVSGYAELIDQGALSVAFDGWSRAVGAGDDAHFFRVDFEDELGADIETFMGPVQMSTTWTQTTDSRSAPVGTRRVTARMHCAKEGGLRCDAFFDDVSIVVSYP